MKDVIRGLAVVAAMFIARPILAQSHQHCGYFYGGYDVVIGWHRHCNPPIMISPLWSPAATFSAMAQLQAVQLQIAQFRAAQINQARQELRKAQADIEQSSQSQRADRRRQMTARREAEHEGAGQRAEARKQLPRMRVAVGD
jgi:hypothetical protein